MAGAVGVFVATSLDGFVAGPDDELSWLPPPRPNEDYGYGAFMAATAAILMGRSFEISPQTLFGDLFCLLAGILYAG